MTLLVFKTKTYHKTYCHTVFHIFRILCCLRITIIFAFTLFAHVKVIIDSNSYLYKNPIQQSTLPKHVHTIFHPQFHPQNSEIMQTKGNPSADFFNRHQSGDNKGPLKT